MTRKLARVVTIDGIQPIVKADAIEAAQVGGWKVVVKKGEFSPGDRAVYFEIDSFLPAGNPAWQFLVDKQPRHHEEQLGHVLASVRLRGQLSQGLLLRLDALGLDPAAVQTGDEVSELLGVSKFEKPIPAELLGLIRGYMPSRVPKTDEERLQNLATEHLEWQSGTVWEVSEKLEGESCTYAWLDGELHVCTRQLDLLEVSNHPMWHVARRYELEARLRAAFGPRNVALQGEHVGEGVEGNIYRLKGQDFYLYKVYDVNEGRYLDSNERRGLAKEMGLKHVPVLDEAFTLDQRHDMDTLLAMADGPSVLLSTQRREGVVYKSRTEQVSFKTISNAYLLNQKL